MPDLWFLDEIPSDSLLAVGGKGLSLALTAQAGLPVPPAFVITTDAYRRARNGTHFTIASDLRAAIESAYSKLGGGVVAVRSSATTEDGADASFAGQQETILGVSGTSALLDAIERCWKSLLAPRAIAYRKQQGLADDGAAMAVVVQRLIAAEVAGVLFTRDPQDPRGESLAIEASWGLGEAVVSGRVMPDRFRVHRSTSEIRERTPGVKSIQFTERGEEPVPASRVHRLCLSDANLSALAELGRRVEEFYQEPRDIEWALLADRVYLLQARPITTATATEREAVAAEVRQQVSELADPGGTVWVRYNLSEVLPEPTPMTWSIVSRMLAQDGGFGAMNRDFAAEPDSSLGSQSAFDLIAGRPMMNLARLPRMQFRRPPMEYPFAAFKQDPRLALNPKPTMNPLRGGLLAGLLRLPGTLLRLTAMMNQTRRLAVTFATEFETNIAPQFRAEAQAALKDQWTALEPKALTEQLHQWIQRTLIDFARHSLKPTVLADLSWTTLLDLLRRSCGDDQARAIVARVAAGAAAPAELNFAQGVQDFASGVLDRNAFLDRFGHRCRHEMELSSPRWLEDPHAVDQLMRGKSQPIRESSEAEPLDRIAQETRLAGAQRTLFLEWAARLRTYLGLREAAKNDLLRGYAVIRRILLELDSRFQLQGGIFHLVLQDLPELLAGKNLQFLIAQRKKRRQLELQLPVPSVLFSDDLEAIGRVAPPPADATTWTGVALSAGVAEAPALVLTDPGDPPNDEPYVLVCPSTDPAWVPLFAQAKALVMETGGVLSHGAIVAREFGLPAVAGLPGILQQIRTGQRLRVDGLQGTVSALN